MFVQDTTILVISRGIQPEYAFFKFLKSIISIFILVLYYLFLGYYNFRPVYYVFPMPCVISENQKQIGKGASSV
jgi:hypothetical protein